MQENITYIIYNESLDGYIDKSGSVSSQIRMAETFMDKTQCKVEIQRRSKMYKEVPSYDEQNWKIKTAMIGLISEDALLPPPPEQPVCQLPANPDGAVVTDIPAEPVTETPVVITPVATITQVETMVANPVPATTDTPPGVGEFTTPEILSTPQT